LHAGGGGRESVTGHIYKTRKRDAENQNEQESVMTTKVTSVETKASARERARKMLPQHPAWAHDNMENAAKWRTPK
jgi:hypothetical protein